MFTVYLKFIIQQHYILDLLFILPQVYKLSKLWTKIIRFNIYHIFYSYQKIIHYIVNNLITLNYYSTHIDIYTLIYSQHFQTLKFSLIIMFIYLIYDVCPKIPQNVFYSYICDCTEIFNCLDYWFKLVDTDALAHSHYSQILVFSKFRILPYFIKKVIFTS